MIQHKKLIEVALPLEAINKASAREKSIRHGHPSTLHLWWARRPLAAARAVIFAQMVDDPSAHPEQFPTAEAQETERQRLFRLIEELVQWENTTNEEVLNRAREEIWKSWRATCAANRDHPQAEELFNPEKLPAFHDPFAGGGALPLEAQRLGLEAYASDLNPVAVLINKAMIEIPPKFAGMPPVNPEARKEQRLFAKTWRGAEGLAEDVRYYGQWMRDEAEKRIGHLYPKVEITAEMAKERPDLSPLVGQKLMVIAWIWARTVKSSNPAYSHVPVPLTATFMLSTKIGKEAYIEPIVNGDNYRFVVRVGMPRNLEETQSGTKLTRGPNFRCLLSGSPISGDHIKSEGKAGRLGAKLMAIVAEGSHGRIYLSPTKEQQVIASRAFPAWKPEGKIVEDARAFTPFLYGMTEWSDLFTGRQLAALTFFSDIILEVREQVKQDTMIGQMPNDHRGINDNGIGTSAYADSIALYLAFQVDQLSNHLSEMCTWHVNNQQLKNTFARQVLPITWDYAEVNPLSNSTGSLSNLQERQVKGILGLVAQGNGSAIQVDAIVQNITVNKVVSTDPPYYDNIPYADLSDFFYVWLRRSLKSIFPTLFTTLAVPKSEELVATPYRHGGKAQAEAFFLNGMTGAMNQIAKQSHLNFPVTIYYAFKQTETGKEGTTSTGWETFLEAMNTTGFAISGTWPIRTEQTAAMKTGLNALATSIIIVCRQRQLTTLVITRRDFINALRTELPIALILLQRGNIAPVDLAQAAIGPGMAVYTRYAKVLDAAGKPLSVREALALINETLDEVLAEQEGDFDADTRWALAWFEQFGFNDGPFGDAETLSKAKNTAINGLEQAGIVLTKAGRVRLLRPTELPSTWNPTTDKRLTVWETVHHLIRVLEADGESAAADLVAQLGTHAEIARELAYRLYTICERRKRAGEALSYNGLVQSWPEITRLAQEAHRAQLRQGQLI